MSWQDWVFSVGGLVVLVSLLPTIRGVEKPALATSVTTFILVAIFAGTMASLHLWLSALTNALISLAWGILALQRYRYDWLIRSETLPVVRRADVSAPAADAEYLP
jgi:hypothetical protein